jgi:hypothetical protein
MSELFEIWRWNLWIRRVRAMLICWALQALCLRKVHVKRMNKGSIIQHTDIFSRTGVPSPTHITPLSLQTTRIVPPPEVSASKSVSTVRMPLNLVPSLLQPCQGRQHGKGCVVLQSRSVQCTVYCDGPQVITGKAFGTVSAALSEDSYEAALCGTTAL